MVRRSFLHRMLLHSPLTVLPPSLCRVSQKDSHFVQHRIDPHPYRILDLEWIQGVLRQLVLLRTETKKLYRDQLLHLFHFVHILCLIQGQFRGHSHLLDP